MKRRSTKRRAHQLDRDIARALAGRTKRGYHATIRECATWAPEATVEPLTEAKRQSATEFERCYLVNLMAKAGTVSEAARLAGLDRSNFKKLLHRHGLRVAKDKEL
jgi:transcriptional regulator with GAF, ATPase, and Fis domain